MDRKSQLIKEKAIVFLINDWSSNKGGIQTVNRELCIALAQLYTSTESPLNVICLVESASNDNIKEALEHNVELLISTDLRTNNKDSRILEYMSHPKLEELNVCYVAGHSKFTGVAACNLANDINNKPHFIYFVHMDPEQDEMIKMMWLDDGVEEKDLTEEKVATIEKEIRHRIDLEKRMINKAYKVMAVGPKLSTRARTILDNEDKNKVVELLCGLHAPPLHTVRERQPEELRFLALGRTDNIYVKGQDIFAKAAGIVTKKWKDIGMGESPKFVVCGAGEGKTSALKNTLEKKAKKESGNHDVTITVFPYTDNIEKIRDEIKHSTAVIMPSRSEGFGLVGTEAASYMVPIIVSAGSGLGMHLKDNFEQRAKITKERWDQTLSIFETRRDDAHEILADVMLRLAKDDEIGKLSGIRTNDLLQDCSWKNAAIIFSHSLKLLPVDLYSDFPNHFKLPKSLLEFAMDLPNFLSLGYSLSNNHKFKEGEQQELENCLSFLSKTYNELKGRKRLYGLKLSEKIMNSLPRNLEKISRLIKIKPMWALSLMLKVDFEAFFELNVACLLTTNDPKRLNDIFLEILALIECAFANQNNEDAFGAVVPGVESLVWALQKLDKDNRESVIQFLKALAAEDDEWVADRANIKTVMQQLLQSAFYVEVYDFLRTDKNLPHDEQLSSLLRDVNSSVISVLSRKGGTGKTLLSMLTILSYLQTNPSSKVCIIDMDFTGPSWQYLLFPEEDKPNKFLNDLFNEGALTRRTFSFSTELIKDRLSSILQSRMIFNPEGKISLLSLRDLPRTNRLLQDSITQNPSQYSDFLIQIVKCLGGLGYPLVIIDNAPGFSIIPLISHSISSHLKHGGSVVVSTPYMPDIRGVMIDLSDERILNRGKEPIWVINKIMGKAKEFLKKKHTIYELASATKAYGTILPQRPLLIKMQDKLEPPFKQLQLDKSFLSFVTVEDRVIERSPEDEVNLIIKKIMKSKLFRQFKRQVAPSINKKFNINTAVRIRGSINRRGK